jgi:hypothetical protein
MAIVHDTQTKNLIVDTVCNTLDGGATIEFMTDADVVLTTIALDSNAFAAAVAGEATANGFPKTGTIVVAGTLTKFQIKDATAVPRIFGTITVAGSGGDIELTSVVYAISEIVTLNSLTYRVPN